MAWIPGLQKGVKVQRLYRLSTSLSSIQECGAVRLLLSTGGQLTRKRVKLPLQVPHPPDPLWELEKDFHNVCKWFYSFLTFTKVRGLSCIHATTVHVHSLFCFVKLLFLSGGIDVAKGFSGGY